MSSKNNNFIAYILLGGFAFWTGSVYAEPLDTYVTSALQERQKRKPAFRALAVGVTEYGKGMTSFHGRNKEPNARKAVPEMMRALRVVAQKGGYFSKTNQANGNVLIEGIVDYLPESNDNPAVKKFKVYDYLEIWNKKLQEYIEDKKSKPSPYIDLEIRNEIEDAIAGSLSTHHSFLRYVPSPNNDLIKNRLKQYVRETSGNSDTLIFYFSGHGVVKSFQGNRLIPLLLLTHSTGENFYLRFDELVEILQEGKAGRRIVFLDFCQTIEDLGDVQKFFIPSNIQETIDESDIMFFFSSNKGTPSYVDSKDTVNEPASKMGFFTKNLIAGLDDLADGYGGSDEMDGYLSMNELGKYLKQNVKWDVQRKLSVKNVVNQIPTTFPKNSSNANIYGHKTSPPKILVHLLSSPSKPETFIKMEESSIGMKPEDFDKFKPEAQKSAEETKSNALRDLEKTASSFLEKAIKLRGKKGETIYLNPYDLQTGENSPFKLVTEPAQTSFLSNTEQIKKWLKNTAVFQRLELDILILGQFSWKYNQHPKLSWVEIKTNTNKLLGSGDRSSEGFTIYPQDITEYIGNPKPYKIPYEFANNRTGKIQFLDRILSQILDNHPRLIEKTIKTSCFEAFQPTTDHLKAKNYNFKDKKKYLPKTFKEQLSKHGIENYNVKIIKENADRIKKDCKLFQVNATNPTIELAKAKEAEELSKVTWTDSDKITLELEARGAKKYDDMEPADYEIKTRLIHNPSSIDLAHAKIYKNGKSEPILIIHETDNLVPTKSVIRSLAHDIWKEWPKIEKEFKTKSLRSGTTTTD